MYTPPPEQEQLFKQAALYQRLGDVYQAVKVFKLLVKKAPEWQEPYLKLIAIFKERKEWKAVAHYSKKVLVLNPSLQESWWDLGIAQFAGGKKRAARRIWNKFGWNQQKLPAVLSVQVSHSGIFELLWVKPLNPVSGMIVSIPHPQSDRSYRDILLFDQKVLGYNVVNQQRMPIYKELDLIKRSYYNTFSGIIEQPSEQDIELMTKLAKDEGIGFELWSNASKSSQLQNKTQSSEFYNTNDFAKSEDQHALIALAGKTSKVVRQMIRAWEVISLKEVVDFEQHK